MNDTTEKPNEFVDSQRLLESANDSARHFRNIYAAYLTVMIYTLVVVLSTDQELLFKAGDKQLPLVHITIPIKEFFIYMPLAILVIHFYLLIQASFLADKVRDYISEIEKRLGSQERDKAYRLLFPVPLAHTFGEGKTQRILYLIIFVSLVIFPLGTLITARAKFLPYQSVLISSQHFIIMLIDIVLLGYFWNRIRSKNKYLNYAFTLIGAIILLSISLHLGKKSISEIYYFDLPNSTLVKKEPAPEILATYHTREGNLVTKPDKSVWCELAEPLDLSDRNLINAKLSKTKICSATFTETNLTRADLTEANLTRADLTEANLTQADLTETDLTKADLSKANLTQAVLRGTILTEAVLTEADLTQTDFAPSLIETLSPLIQALTGNPISTFPQKDFAKANLTRADLTQADLTGATPREVDLTDANLTKANLTGADLPRANLTRANLRNADLFGVNLSETNFTSATMTNATITYSWIHRDRKTKNTKYLPVGIPKGRKNTLKPDYLCSLLFDIGDYVDFSKYINKKRKLKDELSRSELQEALKNLKSEQQAEVARTIKIKCERKLTLKLLKKIYLKSL